MKKISLIVALMSCISASAFINPDTTARSIFEKGLDQIRLQKARHLFMTYDYQGALAIYEALHLYNQSNPILNYRIGECNFAMRAYETSIYYFDKAQRTAEDVHRELHLNYGKALHRMGELDRAMEQFEKFKPKLTDKAKDEYLWDEVNQMIEQINTAKQMMANPVNVTIKNLGDVINSKYDDHGPSVSKDGKLLVFTSRRPETKGGRIDPYDNKYLEDIYVATWNEKEKKWDKAEQAKGRLNTEDHDGCLSLSPNGEEIYVYKNEGDAGSGSGDIYVSRMSSSGKWGTPKELGKTINTTYFESSASITEDENKLFFISERKDGLGSGDIWMVEKISRKEWGEAKNLGDVINTSADERMVFVHPDGNTLFFSSNGRNTMGGYDIFMSKFENGQWAKPTNLGYPINTVNDEINFTLTYDNKRAYTSAFKYSGLGEIDIYEIDLSKHKIVEPRELPKIEMITVTGTIYTTDSAGVSGCKIELIENATGNLIKEKITDNNGQYSFIVEKGKVYRFIAKKAGFITTESAEIKTKDIEGKELVKNMILKQ